jgi:hypothetical protein
LTAILDERWDEKRIFSHRQGPFAKFKESTTHQAIAWREDSRLMSTLIDNQPS